MKLPHPSASLLSSFVTEALNPTSAAHYVSDRLTEGEDRSLVYDWIRIVDSISQHGSPPQQPNAEDQRAITKRDGGKCCVTGKAGTLSDPLIVAPILPVPSGWLTDQPRIFDMLGAFFGHPYRDWWLSYAEAPQFTSPYQTHWLIRKSVASSFAQGFIRLDRLQPSMVEYKVTPLPVGLEKPIDVDGSFPLLGDHSRSGIEKVDPRFIGTHARLSRSIQLVGVARKIAPEIISHPSDPVTSHSQSRSTPKSPLSTLKRISPTSFGLRPFLSPWFFFPNILRSAAYELLRKVGKFLYGRPNGYSTVQRLPFGFYLKFQGDPDDVRNEFNALQMVRRHTSIPVPEPLDVITKPRDAKDPFSCLQSYLLITRLPGIPLFRCQAIMSDRDLDEITLQLKDYMTQLRAIPKTVNPDMAICNTLGKACRDPRIHGGDPVGPFVDEAAFSQVLRFSDEPSRRDHKAVFTHADLNPRNILVSRVGGGDSGSGAGWIVTGIVDWETAGYYPEYWDYTKTMFEGFRWPRRYNDMMKGVFEEFGDYSAELGVETRSWEMGDGV